MADNLNKRPKKGILKNSSSFDTQEVHPTMKHKETKWDEMNIIATLHPADKTYGHMKIDEPKTPYNYDGTSADEIVSLDATDLAARIAQGSNEPPKVLQEHPESDNTSDDDEMTQEELQQRKEFEIKRKKHYNEYYAMKLARKLLKEQEEEDEDEDDEEADHKEGPSGSQPDTQVAEEKDER